LIACCKNGLRFLVARMQETSGCAIARCSLAYRSFRPWRYRPIPGRNRLGQNPGRNRYTQSPQADKSASIHSRDSQSLDYTCLRPSSAPCPWHR
jgi:hypothetical protein